MAKLTPQRQKFKEWLEEQKANGLKRVHYSLSDEILDNLKNVDLEELAGEINRFNEAVLNSSEEFSFNDSKRRP